MREHLFELSAAELQDLYIHETKALTFALEAGVPWEDLQYVRDSLKDITRYIDARLNSPKHAWRKRSGENPPRFAWSPDYPIDSNPVTY